MEALKKVLNIIIDIFIVLVVIISSIVAAVALTSKESGVPNLFGYVPFSVQTDSMSPAFEAGDLIVAKRIFTSDKDKDIALKEGDVITYTMYMTDTNGNSVQALNTHRIINVISGKNGGEDTFETKGDNNPEKDSETVKKADVVAIWSQGDEDGMKLKKVGGVFDFLRQPKGFFIAVLLPMIAFFVYELVRFIMNFRVYNQEKQKEAALAAAKELMGGSSDSSGLSEEQKAQAILDFLEKQKAEQEAAPPAAPEAQPSAAEPPAEAIAQAEETEQPASTETAVTEPEQETSVSEAAED